MRARGCSRSRSSAAALVCYKSGRSSRLIYRFRADARRDGLKSSAWTDYRDLIQAACPQLGGPIVLAWDHLNTHLTVGIRKFTAERDAG